MERLDSYMIRFIFVGLVAVIELATGGRANADFVFGTPQNLGPVINGPYADYGISFSADGLELYFSSNRPGGFAGGMMGTDLWVSTRASMDDPWGPPVNLGPAVNSTTDEASPSISPDGLTLYFGDEWGSPIRPGSLGGADIWMARRAGRRAPWGTAVNVGAPIDTPANEVTPMLSADGLTLIFASDRAGGQGNYDLWMSTRTTLQDQWGEPVNLGGLVNSTYRDIEPSLSPDKRALVFASERAGGYGSWDLWMTTRKTQSDAWGPPVNLGPRFNSAQHEGQPVISADGGMLYFYASGHPGNLGWYDLWEAPIIPIVDLNGDGKVDGKEVLVVAQHWGQNYPPCDIGPYAWGDGTVDTNDLAVLAAYIGQEVNDPTLIAHWALDEAEGMTGGDGAGGNDALVLGNAAWQPAGGKLGGALAFDGKDDFATTGKPVLDPAAGPFSVIAWVKGGGAGRVIVSQASGVDWLYVNQFGMLTTDLKSSGREAQSLTSDACVPDDQWHRVVLTLDGTDRALYLDDVEVARDTQTNLKASNGNLLIGVGKTMASTSFWSGLIDEVRIYNRAVQP